MELHRAGKKSDWADVPRSKRNAWQQLANNTNGVMTPGNFLTVLGFGLVLAGLALVVQEQYWGGLALMFVGRCCDLLDGWLADRTGTKSPLGEVMDATADKLETVAAVVVLVTAGLVPWQAALAVVLPQAVISLVSVSAWRRGKQLHPSRLGKLSMAAVWVALGSFVLLEALGWNGSGLWWNAAHIVCAAAVLMGAASVYGYIEERL